MQTKSDKTNSPASEPTAGSNNQRQQGPNRRETVVDRRAGLDRRQQTRADSGYTGPERRVASRREDTGLERRRGPGRRLSDNRRSAEEGEMTTEQFEFVMAIETYKKVNKRLYPTWTEVLEVINQLGYRKISHRDIELKNVPEPDLCKVA
jgi:IS5 family transposase